MLGYFDTSAIVPLLVAESTTTACQRFWQDCDDVVTNVIAYAEASAALAMAERMERLGRGGYVRSLAALDALWQELDLIPVDDALVHHAAGLARSQALRGYDAVHCASADLLRDAQLVAASGDQRLLEVWRNLGVDTYDTTTR